MRKVLCLLLTGLVLTGCDKILGRSDGGDAGTGGSGGPASGGSAGGSEGDPTRPLGSSDLGISPRASRIGRFYTDRDSGVIFRIKHTRDADYWYRPSIPSPYPIKDRPRVACEDRFENDPWREEYDAGFESMLIEGPVAQTLFYEDSVALGKVALELVRSGPVESVTVELKSGTVWNCNGPLVCPTREMQLSDRIIKEDKVFSRSVVRGEQIPTQDRGAYTTFVFDEVVSLRARTLYFLVVTVQGEGDVEIKLSNQDQYQPFDARTNIITDEGNLLIKRNDFQTQAGESFWDYEQGEGWQETLGMDMNFKTYHCD